MEKFMNIKKNNLFKKDFNYPLFSRVRIKSDMTFFFVLEQRTFLFNKKIVPILADDLLLNQTSVESDKHDTTILLLCHLTI